MNSPLVPLDLRLDGVEIQKLLEDYRSQAGQHFDMSTSIERARELLEELGLLYQLRDSLTAALLSTRRQAALGMLKSSAFRVS
jgi:hypothetical protein